MTVKNAPVQDAPVWRLVEGRGTEAIAVRFRDGSVIFGALYRKVRFFSSCRSSGTRYLALLLYSFIIVYISELHPVKKTVK